MGGKKHMLLCRNSHIKSIAAAILIITMICLPLTSLAALPLEKHLKYHTNDNILPSQVSNPPRPLEGFEIIIEEDLATMNLQIGCNFGLMPIINFI